MAYTHKNFRTKKALKEAVKAYADHIKRTAAADDILGTPGATMTVGALLVADGTVSVPQPVTAYQPGPFGPDLADGSTCLEGPHYPEPHRWYASATIKDGIVVKVS